MRKQIAVIRGDGIGPEIVQQALKVLNRIAQLYDHVFDYVDVDMGGCALDRWGDPLPEEMLQRCLQSDSVLLGAVGGDQWNDVPGPMRPEKGLLKLRAGMGVYSNNRPAKIWPQLADAIEQAVAAYLDAGYRTADIMSEGNQLVGCNQCGDLICTYLQKR